ncbi:MAG: hypothetical protein QM783_13000 [Phycisphaerales bacterium]
MRKRPRDPDAGRFPGDIRPPWVLSIDTGVDADDLSPDQWKQTRSGAVELDFRQIIALPNRRGFWCSASSPNPKGPVALLASDRVYLIDTSGDVRESPLPPAPPGYKVATGDLYLLGKSGVEQLVVARHLDPLGKPVTGKEQGAVEFLLPLTNEPPWIVSLQNRYVERVCCIENAEGRLGAAVMTGPWGAKVIWRNGREEVIATQPSWAAGHVPRAALVQEMPAPMNKRSVQRITAIELTDDQPVLTTAFEAGEGQNVELGNQTLIGASPTLRGRGALPFTTQFPGKHRERWAMRRRGDGDGMVIADSVPGEPRGGWPLTLTTDNGSEVQIATWGDLVRMSGTGPSARHSGRSVSAIGAFLADHEKDAAAWRIDGYSARVVELSPSSLLITHNCRAWVVTAHMRRPGSQTPSK